MDTIITILITVFKNPIALSSESSTDNLLYKGIKLVANEDPIIANNTIGILFAVV